MKRTLHEIGMGTGTDKVTFHGYDKFYEVHFSRFRDLPITFLEIGVLRGQSLRMWEEYFPNARIFGIDCEPAATQYASARTRIFTGRQEDPDFLWRVADATGPLDLVVDDGGHTMVQQITSFERIFPKIKPGGIYAVEDLATSLLHGYGANGPRTMIGTIQASLGSMTSSQRIQKSVMKLSDMGYGPPVRPTPFAASAPAPVSAVHFYNIGIAFIERAT